MPSCWFRNRKCLEFKRKGQKGITTGFVAAQPRIKKSSGPKIIITEDSKDPFTLNFIDLLLLFIVDRRPFQQVVFRVRETKNIVSSFEYPTEPFPKNSHCYWFYEQSVQVVFKWYKHFRTYKKPGSFPFFPILLGWWQWVHYQFHTMWHAIVLGFFLSFPKPRRNNLH